MGNKGGKPGSCPSASVECRSDKDQRFLFTYKQWSEDKDFITESVFQKQFGYRLGKLLYQHGLKECKSVDFLDETAFLRFATRLSGASIDQYIQIFCEEDQCFSTENLKEMLHLSLAAVGQSLLFSDPLASSSGDELLIENLVADINSCAVRSSSISSVLSCCELWFLQSCLPICYVPSAANDESNYTMDCVGDSKTVIGWQKLYSSFDDGISCNRTRGVPLGLIVGVNLNAPLLKIEADFSNVSAVEVPLPGKWEENTDKYLLEMAGVKVSHSEMDRS